MTVAEIILSKVPMPTHLKSAAIREQVAQRLREQAFFSAQMTLEGYLKDLQRLLGAFARGEMDASQVRIAARSKLDELGFRTDATGLEDPRSPRRLNLILKTNQQLAAGMAQRDAGNDPLLAKAFPAWELVCGGFRRVHRSDWPRRWQAAGDAVGWQGALKGRRMAALKTSPIWQALGDGAGGFRDTLGNPYPPFAFGSSYEWSELSRLEAQDLGLLPKADKTLNKRPRDTAGHFAETDGEPCTHDKPAKDKGEKKADDTRLQRTRLIQAGYKGKCSQKDATDLLDDGLSIKDSAGKGVRFDRFVRDHYEKGLRRKDNQPKPQNLELLPMAIYAVRHGTSTLKFPKGTTPDYLNPPKGSQRVYSSAYGKERILVYVYADTGKVSGWHTEK